MLEKLVPFLQDPDNGIWFETVEAVARYLKQHRQE